MKKTSIAALCFALSMLLASCGTTPVSESSAPTNANSVIKWFDCLDGDVWEDIKEYHLDEFPGVTFRCNQYQVEAVTDGETIPLFYGMPVCNIYFYDLTGDGNPELCSTIDIGSGIVDERIIVYDYAGGASYELSDRGNFNYTLYMKEDSLVVEKLGEHDTQYALVESGELVFVNDTIQIKTEE